MTIRLLVAEDDPLMRDLLEDILKKDGFSVTAVPDGQEALNVFFEAPEFDLILLDVMMPQVNGWEALSAIRESSEVPVIMLTALGDIQNEVKGLETGATDYISKPFSYEVFQARIKAALRSVIQKQYDVQSLGLLSVHPISQLVEVEGHRLELNHKEYCLLQYFIKNRNCVLSRDQILMAVWGYDFDGDIRTIDTHVKMLRAKLGICGTYIRTVRGSGYRFEVMSDEEH